MSLIQLNGPNGPTEAIEKYIHSIGTKRVIHLSYFKFDIERIKQMINESNLEGLERIMVSDCCSLDQIDKIIQEVVESSYKTPVEVIVIEDMDKAFNVSAFKEYANAGVMITRILRNLRKIAYKYSTLCYLTQCGGKPSYSIRYVDKLVVETCDC